MGERTDNKEFRLEDEPFPVLFRPSTELDRVSKEGTTGMISYGCV